MSRGSSGYGPPGIFPGRVSPGGLQSGTQPWIGLGTGAAVPAEGTAPPAAPAGGDGCWDPPEELHAAPSSPAAR